MHTQETIEQCLKLRAQARSYRRIAEELKVSVPTVEKWIKAHEAQINQMRADRLEALHEQYLGNYEDKLFDMANEVAAINAELKLRDFSCVSTEFSSIARPAFRPGSRSWLRARRKPWPRNPKRPLLNLNPNPRPKTSTFVVQNLYKRVGGVVQKIKIYERKFK